MKKNCFNLGLSVLLGIVTVMNLNLIQKTDKVFYVTLKSLQTISQDENGNNSQESNNNGSGLFFYEHLQGSPQECTLYRNVNINGQIEISSSSRDGEIGWTSIKISGIKELCPKKGEGCTVYSCRQTNN